MLKVSIIVPTYNREERLCDTLMSLQKIDYQDFEVIVVDQTKHHKRETEDFLKKLKNKIKYFKLEKPHYTKALNAGAEMATGDILLFIDDDVEILTKDFIKYHVRNYADKSIGGVCGCILHQNEEKPLPYRGEKFTWIKPFFNRDKKMEIEVAPCANFSVRKEVFESAGKFDEKFEAGGFLHEIDFCFRLKKLGFKIIYEPKAILRHFYGTEGGAQNKLRLSAGIESFKYFVYFFQNVIYFLLKHFKGFSFLKYLWHYLREYWLNRPLFMRGGFFFLFHRGYSFILGFLRAVKKYRLTY